MEESHEEPLNSESPSSSHTLRQVIIAATVLVFAGAILLSTTPGQHLLEMVKAGL